MVSFQRQTLFHGDNLRGSNKAIFTTVNYECELQSLKKRKWEEEAIDLRKKLYVSTTSTKEENMKWSNSDIGVDLDTPLPLEWQRCLDINSGEIHFYNTRTQKRTSKDPRTPPTPKTTVTHLSLDLQLNQPINDSLICTHKPNEKDDKPTKDSYQINHQTNQTNKNRLRDDVGKCSPSWLGFDMNKEAKEEEMVARVCVKCYMLVMVFKSFPACPNCKFMHPPEQTPSKLFKHPILKLSC